MRFVWLLHPLFFGLKMYSVCVHSYTCFHSHSTYDKIILIAFYCYALIFSWSLLSVDSLSLIVAPSLSLTFLISFLLYSSYSSICCSISLYSSAYSILFHSIVTDMNSASLSSYGKVLTSFLVISNLVFLLYPAYIICYSLYYTMNIFIFLTMKVFLCFAFSSILANFWKLLSVIIIM